MDRGSIALLGTSFAKPQFAPEPPEVEPLVGGDRGAPTDRMLLGMARFLLGEDERAREDLDRAYAESGGRVSGIAQAMRAWLHGSDEEARRRIEPLLDHPVWGTLARRAAKRQGAG